MRNTINIWFVWLDPTSIYNMHIKFKTFLSVKLTNLTIQLDMPRSALKYGKVKYNLTPYTNAGPFNLKDLLV